MITAEKITVTISFISLPAGPHAPTAAYVSNLGF